MRDAKPVPTYQLATNAVICRPASGSRWRGALPLAGYTIRAAWNPRGYLYDGWSRLDVA